MHVSSLPVEQEETLMLCACVSTVLLCGDCR